LLGRARLSVRSPRAIDFGFEGTTDNAVYHLDIGR
jgi:hypothetical protein